jgi:pyruvate/2-oxoglutarate dehydrogenase complex dihydrolipoamide dehydrogenase (E3) component
MEEFGLRPPGGPVDWERAVLRKDAVVEHLRSRSARQLEERGIHRVRRPVAFRDSRTVESDEGMVHARRIILATGAETVRPAIPGIEHALDNADLLGLRTAPRRLLVIGGGVIGLEFASIFGRVGSQVDVFEAGEEILPDIDPDVREALIASHPDLRVRTRAEALRIDRKGESVVLQVRVAGREESREGDAVLVATGRGPRVRGLGLERIGVRLGKKGIETDEYLETDALGIYAAGDAHGRFHLTPVAHYEGSLAAANALDGPRRKADYRVVPRTLFTLPQASSVGLTESEARREGREVASSLVRFDEIGAGLASDRTEGFVKVIVDRISRELVGAHILGEESEELIHLPALAMKAGLNADDILGTLGIHPARSEAFFSAVSKADVSQKARSRIRRAS